MALKEKLKALITNHSPTSSKTGSPVISEPTTGRWPSNVYKPGEPMPRLKYRAPVKKEHKEKLESFNFASSWRRKSHTSIHSPTSSRFPSRRGSRLGAASRNGSIKGGSTSRSNSITGQQDKSRYRHSLRKTQLIAEAAEIQSQMQSYTNSKTFGNTVAEGPDNNGGLTSTVAFMVPPKSAQVYTFFFSRYSIISLTRVTARLSYIIRPAVFPTFTSETLFTDKSESQSQIIDCIDQ